MTAIYKRELCSYFNSMIGWVFVSVLTVFIGIYFFVNNLFAGYPYCSCSWCSSPSSPCGPWRTSATPRRTSCC